MDPSMKKETIFKTTIRFRLGAVYFLVLLSAFFYFAFIVDDLVIRIGIITLTFIMEAFTIERFVAPYWSNFLTISERGIKGFVRRRRVDLRWVDILAFWQPEAHEVFGHLMISTNRGVERVFIGHLDRKNLWKAIQTYANPESLELGRYRETRDFKEYHSVASRILYHVEFPIESNQYPARVIGWFGVIFFSPWIFLVLLTTPKQLWVFFLPIFVFAFGLAVFLVLIIGTLEVDEDKITYHAFFHRYRMFWNEIALIEQDPTGGWWVLSGNGKRLGIPGPSMWAGKRKEQFQVFVINKVAERQIEIQRTGWVNFKFWSKNTVVKGDD